MAGYEVAAFKHCLSVLQTGIQDHLVEITPRLSSRSLISEDDMDRAVSSGVDSRKGRATHLLAVLLNRIRIDPHSFNLILEEFDACAMLQILAKKLREELERVKEEATAPRGDRSDQVEELPTSCGSTDSEKAYTPLDIQAPMAVRQAVPGLLAASSLPLHPAASTAHPDILTVKQKMDTLEEEFENIVIRLFALFSSLAKKSPDFIDVIRAVLLAIPLTLDKKHQHCSFFEKNRDFIESASTVASFQWIICSYCNFLNVSLFEQLMKKLGADLKADFRVYMEHLDEFRACTKIGDFIDAQTLRQDRSILPPEFAKVQIKLGDSWEDCTLKYIQEFHLKLCQKASLAPYAAYLISGEWSCIVLTWGIAGAAVSAILQVLDEAGMAAFDFKAVDCDATAAALESLPVSEQVTPETELAEKMEHLATGTEQHSPTESLTQPTGFTDSQWCETVLTKIIPFLGINTDLLLSRMVFLDLIDSDERETILSQRSTIDRSHNIVSAVKRKGLAGYWRFCDCLVMDRSMSHISKDWNMSHNEYISYVLCREAEEAHVNRADLRPTMAELTCLPVRGRILNIPKEVPLHKSELFGMGLLSDGNIVGDIIGRCGDNLMRANTEVLQAWLDGKGENVTWRYLWTILSTIGCLDLSRLIRHNITLEYMYIRLLH